jgi:hypothetical protein
MIIIMRLELLAKDALSGEKNCPSVHDDLDGTDFVLVGPTVDSAHLENILLGEGVIRMNRELTWGYQPNVEAGEDIKIVPVAPGDLWPSELPQGTDFWLFDFSVLYALRYGQDGTWLAAEEVTEPTAIEQACRWRETALRLAMPWRRYLDVHPDLARIVPPGEPRAS